MPVLCTMFWKESIYGLSYRETINRFRTSYSKFSFKVGEIYPLSSVCILHTYNQKFGFLTFQQVIALEKFLFGILGGGGGGRGREGEGGGGRGRRWEEEEGSLSAVV